MGLFTNVTPRMVEFMEERSLEQLEAGVERLLNELSRLKSENSQLREQVIVLEAGKSLFRDRLDLLINRLEQVDSP